MLSTQNDEQQQANGTRLSLLFARFSFASLERGRSGEHHLNNTIDTRKNLHIAI